MPLFYRLFLTGTLRATLASLPRKNLTLSTAAKPGSSCALNGSALKRVTVHFPFVGSLYNLKEGLAMETTGVQVVGRVGLCVHSSRYGIVAPIGWRTIEDY